MSELTLPQPLTPQCWLTFWAPSGAQVPSAHWPQVSRLVSDSRQVQPGDAFLGLPGVSQNGTAFFDQALAAGAVVLVSEGHSWQVNQYQGVLHLQLPLLSQRLGDWLAQLTGLAYSPMNIASVTGTNGKSSVAHYLAQAWQALGYNARVIGTLGRGRPDQLEPTTHTTPDLLTLHRWLGQWLAEGVTHVAMEASSHALDQGRLNGLPVSCGVLTQLSRDHLDYHVSMEAYGEAKARLFLRPELKAAVINQSDHFGQSLINRLSASVKTVRYAAERVSRESIATDALTPELADLSIEEAQFHDEGIRALVRYGQGASAEREWLEAPLIGAFNLANLLAVLGVLLSEGLALSQALLAMSHLQPVTGRMQRLTRPGAPTVVVDYAHTPDALANALAAVRLHCQGRVWCVFGCGGDRDTGKRAEMGRIAPQYADQVIVTDDNPRSEDPKVIRSMILTACLAQAETQRARVDHAGGAGGMSRCDERCYEVAPREAALAHAVQQAAPEDWVLVAGKGHEDYQEVQGVRHHFSDIEQVQRLLSEEVRS